MNGKKIIDSNISVHRLLLGCYSIQSHTLSCWLRERCNCSEAHKRKGSFQFESVMADPRLRCQPLLVGIYNL